MVEFLHRLDEAQVALLDEVQELHAAAHIPLGDGHHQTQVCLGQALLGLFALAQHGVQLGQLRQLLLVEVQLFLGHLAAALRLGELDVLLNFPNGGEGLFFPLLRLGTGQDVQRQLDLLVAAEQGHTADLL